VRSRFALNVWVALTSHILEATRHQQNLVCPNENVTMKCAVIHHFQGAACAQWDEHDQKCCGYLLVAVGLPPEGLVTSIGQMVSKAEPALRRVRVTGDDTHFTSTLYFHTLLPHSTSTTLYFHTLLPHSTPALSHPRRGSRLPQTARQNMFPDYLRVLDTATCSAYLEFVVACFEGGHHTNLSNRHGVRQTTLLA
jgi:hypothetical protein